LSRKTAGSNPSASATESGHPPAVSPRPLSVGPSWRDTRRRMAELRLHRLDAAPWAMSRLAQVCRSRRTAALPAAGPGTDPWAAGLRSYSRNWRVPGLRRSEVAGSSAPCARRPRRRQRRPEPRPLSSAVPEPRFIYERRRTDTPSDDKGAVRCVPQSQPYGPVWSRDHVAGKGLDGMMLGLVACS
jgi:hypothetical protein